MGTTMDGRYLRGLHISGASFTGQFEQITTSIALSLATDKVTELRLGFQDDANLALFRSKILDRGASVSYGEWSMTIDKVDLSKAASGPILDVSALSTFVFKWQAAHGAKTWTNADVTQWFKDRCKEVGATPVVQPGLGRKTIVRESNLDAGFQSTWDVMAQVKRETGVWLFERGKKLIVGRPTWIAKQYTEFREWPLYWNTWYDYHPALSGLPDYKGRNEKKNQETLGFEMMSDDADLMKPGDRVTMGGRNVGAMGGLWLVNSVDYPLTNTGPVKVECVRVVDPAQEKATVTGGLGSTASASAWAATAAPGNTIALTNLPSVVAGHSGQQLVNAAHIIRTSQTMNLPKRAAQLAVAAASADTGLRSINYSTSADPTRRGVLQAPDTWGTYEQRMDPPEAARLFYQRLSNVPGWTGMDPARAIAAVTGGDLSAYRSAWSAGVSIVDALIANNTDTGVLLTADPLTTETSAAVDRYVRSVVGKALDADKVHGAQCVDLSLHYTLAMGGPRIWGNGKDWFRLGGNTSFFTRVAAEAEARKGDIACWGEATGGGWGHVAIVIQDQGATIRCLSQNPGPVTITNISKNNLMGYLRPRSIR